MGNKENQNLKAQYLAHVNFVSLLVNPRRIFWVERHTVYRCLLKKIPFMLFFLKLYQLLSVLQFALQGLSKLGLNA